MTLKFETHDEKEYSSMKDLFSSIITSRFPDYLCQLEISVSDSEDKRVPYKVDLKLEDNDLEASAVSSNLLSAFTQAVNRMASKLPGRRA